MLDFPSPHAYKTINGHGVCVFISITASYYDRAQGVDERTTEFRLYFPIRSSYNGWGWGGLQAEDAPNLMTNSADQKASGSHENRRPL